MKTLFILLFFTIFLASSQYNQDRSFKIDKDKITFFMPNFHPISFNGSVRDSILKYLRVYGLEDEDKMWMKFNTDDANTSPFPPRVIDDSSIVYELYNSSLKELILSKYDNTGKEILEAGAVEINENTNGRWGIRIVMNELENKFLWVDGVLWEKYKYSLPEKAFFPDNAFYDSSIVLFDGYDKSYRTWYSKYLVAFKEPSLYQVEFPNYDAYRFTCIRSFMSDFTIRIEKRDTIWTLYAKELDGGYRFTEPGKISNEVSKVLSQSEINNFHSLMKRMNFWDTKTLEDLPFIGTDGSRWILEGHKRGNYHVVNRWYPTGWNEKRDNDKFVNILNFL